MADEYTAWKASQARPWAENVRRTVARLKQREAALQELAERYDCLQGVSYDRDGSGGVATDGAMAAFVAEADELRAQWAEALGAWRDEVDAFERALRRIDGRYDALLTARYVRDLPWSDVADAIGYAETYVRGDMLTAALAELFDAMPPHLRAIPSAYLD